MVNKLPRSHRLAGSPYTFYPDGTTFTTPPAPYPARVPHVLAYKPVDPLYREPLAADMGARTGKYALGFALWHTPPSVPSKAHAGFYPALHQAGVMGLGGNIEPWTQRRYDRWWLTAVIGMAKQSHGQFRVDCFDIDGEGEWLSRVAVGRHRNRTARFFNWPWREPGWIVDAYTGYLERQAQVLARAGLATPGGIAPTLVVIRASRRAVDRLLTYPGFDQFWTASHTGGIYPVLMVESLDWLADRMLTHTGWIVGMGTRNTTILTDRFSTLTPLGANDAAIATHAGLVADQVANQLVTVTGTKPNWSPTHRATVNQNNAFKSDYAAFIAALRTPTPT